MKKFFLIPLMTLMCSVMAWAVDVSTWDELMSAVATPNAEITLTADCNIPAEGTYDFNGATITCGAYKLVGGVAGDVFTFKNATFTGGTVNNTPAIKVEAGDSVSLVNIASTNLNGACIHSSALALRIGEDCNMACNTRFHAVSNGYNGAKIYNYGTIRGLSTNGSIATIYNYGTINSISQGATSNAIYVSNRSITINNYGLCNGMLYNYSGCGVTIHNYSTGEMVGGVENRDTGDDGYAKANITNEGVFTQTQSVNHGGFSLTNHGTATIQNGTFVKSTRNKYDFLELTGTQPIHIYNGTGTRFVDVPTGSAAIIHPNCIFEQGVGSHTIEDGYMWRESDGMIVELPHIVATITHANSTVEESEDLYDALSTAVDGDVIQMVDDATLNYSLILNADPTIAAKHITLDINGHEMRAITSVKPTIELYAGSLNIINSVPGEGGIYNEAASDAVGILVHGSILKNCNPRTADIADLYTYLNIGEGVDIYAENSGSNAVVVDVAYPYSVNDVLINKGTLIYGTYAETGGNCGVANGVRVDIRGALHAYKYAFKANGCLSYPDATVTHKKGYANYGAYFDAKKEYFYGSGTSVTISEADTAYTPFIHIYPTAVLDANNNNNSAAGIYASGYTRMLMEGTCKGTSALYIKSGVVNVVEDAIIQSTWTGAALAEPGQKSGIKAGGNAIVVESNKSYSGETVLNVDGDARVSTAAQGGIALLETVADGTESLVNAININGGRFTGAYAIAISQSTKDEGRVKVYGTTMNSDYSETESYISPMLAPGAHTTVINNNDGTTTVIVSAGTTPTVITDWGNDQDPQDGEVVDLPSRADANWTGTTPGSISSGNTIELGELQIISGTVGDEQQLTINNNATLKVERLIMNDYATITVEPGGQLIVDGAQGINAPAAENIVLKSSETNQATFLINPEVTSNRHPMAKVELNSKAYKRGENDYVWQRFGIPAYMEGITRGSMVYDHTEFPTSVLKLDYEHNQWAPMANDDEFVPFRCYELTTNADHAGAIYTFECPLMGNGDAELKLEGKWNYYANSYSAPIDIAQMISDFADQNPNVSATVYLYRSIDNWWYEINNANLGETGIPTQIAPMQAFIFQRISEGENPEINYARQIWNPIMNPSANLAPARRAASSTKKAVIEITAADGTKDAIRLVEGANLSADFDNSYDAEKYMNTESFNLYADANEPMAILATDNLEGTTLSMNTKEQTSFIMTISNVNAMDYAIRDNLTGTEAEMAEGATYMFSVPANASIEGRFQIVPIAKTPTAIENMEETAAIKGIYTVSGQFVGNDYHKLPAGVYVVDGKKIVK